VNRIIRADEAQMAQIVEPVLSAAVVEPEATTTVSDPAPVEARGVAATTVGTTAGQVSQDGRPSSPSGSPATGTRVRVVAVCVRPCTHERLRTKGWLGWQQPLRTARRSFSSSPNPERGQGVGSG